MFLFLKNQEQRINIIGSLLMLAGTLVASLSVYGVLQWQQRSTLINALQANLGSKVTLFETQIDEEIGNTLKVANNADFIKAIEMHETKPGDASVVSELDHLAESIFQFGFSGLIFHNVGGQELARAGRFSQKSGQRVLLSTPLQAFLIWDRQFVLHSRQDIINRAGRRIGTVTAETTLPLLTDAFLNIAGVGKTAELAICAPTTDDTKNTDCFLNNLSGQDFKRLSRIMEGNPLPIDYALGGTVGTITTRDYRQEKVIAAYAPAGSLGIGMVMKVDEAELYRSISGQLKFVVPLLAALVVSGMFLLNLLVRPLVGKLVKSEKEAIDAHALLVSSEARFTTIVNLAVDAIISVDEEERILIFNKGAEKIFGYDAAELVAQPLARLIPLRFADPQGKLLFQRAGEPRIGRLLEQHSDIFALRKDGSEFFAEASISQMTENGKLVFTVILRDVSARKEAELLIGHLANHDPLTDLPNRHFLQDRLQQALIHSKRNNTRGAVLFIDLDQFKGINDSMGHDIGDLLLKDVAERLVSSLRSQDTVARQGGDEFIVVLHTLAKAEDAGGTTQKLLNALLRPYHIQNEELRISASVGIAVFPDDGTDANTLLKYSDTAMYHAKEAGRNNFKFFSKQMNQLAKDKQAMVLQLHRALERNELSLRYQPIVDMTSGKLAGLETLLHWQHPQRGLLPPPDFMPLADEVGLSALLGEWALRSACTQLKAWQNQAYDVPPLAIHVSSRQFQQKTIVQAITDILSETGVEAHLVELEITKNVFMENSDEIVENLLTLNDMGLKLSIDDFGASYSSLHHLKRFPISKLKIDEFFIHNIATDPDDAMIVAGVIGLAHSLRMKVRVAGVKTEAQRTILALHGCDEYQGAIFSTSLSSAEIIALLSNSAKLD